MRFDIYYVIRNGVSTRLFWKLFFALALAIMPYLYFLCIFKIPVDFEIWCNENNSHINDFKLFFKRYVLYLLIPIIAFVLFVIFPEWYQYCYLLSLPFIWLYLVGIKKILMFYIEKLWR
ncbi:hypothetical protein CCUN_1008 [Campylobacter cuniculorum DSM 23162 = LMG 24588]|uniref:Uncharacterized protein n=1 Tax=Campylobacter cuniculorum DSM 23162 = LMG 24588 TaxID=1121267 RepID=A0A1W6BX03_9BACT|nr:hypothetical protein CCUN_1008 [Campylobacter cuniculorum DSM 23162 = LMG 24588]